MKYKVHLCQAGEGCDYTIGCGHIVINLNSTNMEAAKVELEEKIRDSYMSMESKLDSAIIFEITNEFYFNIKELDKKIEEEKEEYSRTEKEEREKREFERLKKKFE